MAGSEKKKADDLLQEGYAKYYTAIYRYALSRLGDPHKSEDVAQEAFVVYYKRLRTGEIFTAPPGIFVPHGGSPGAKAV